MAVTNLGELRTRVISWANRTDISNDLIDSFINTAQDRANRILRLPDLEKITTLTITDGAATVPTDYVEAKEMTISTNGRTRALERKDINYIDGLKDFTGTSCYFSRKGTEFLFAPVEQSVTEASLYYWYKLDDLSVDTDTNFLVTDHTEILVYGALAELFLYIRDDSDAGTYEAKFRGALDEAQNVENKAMWSGSPLAVSL